MMADDRKYYVLCEDNCRFESMTKEQILAAIIQAVEGGSVGDVDTGFVTKIVEQNQRQTVTFWVGTQAQYNAITEKTKNCLYIITDETTCDDIENAIVALQESVSSLTAEVSSLTAGTTELLELVSSLTAETAAKDISDDITLEVQSPNVEGVMIASKKFAYVAAMNSVFFSIELNATSLKAAGGFVQIWHSGGHRPAATVAISCASHISGQTSGRRFDGQYEDVDGIGCITLRYDALESSYNEIVYISGWYFTDGAV